MAIWLAFVHTSAEGTSLELSVHHPSPIFVSWTLILHHTQVTNHLEIKYNIQVPMFTICTKIPALHSLECQVPLYIHDPTVTFFIKHQYPSPSSTSLGLKLPLQSTKTSPSTSVCTKYSHAYTQHIIFDP